MKTPVRLLLLFLAGLDIRPIDRASAQDFTTLHSFTAITNSEPYANSDGANPYAGLVLSGDTLYGTARFGGSSGVGAVFKVGADGSGFTNLHSFLAPPDSPYTNSDGSYPAAGLIFSDDTLYGTAYSGGGSGAGTVFKVNTNGTGFTTLHSFAATSGSPDYANSEGANPYAGLVLSGNTLYGTAVGGGSAGAGAVFKVNTDGTGFGNLYSFSAQFGPFPLTNSDGANPYAGLVLSGNTLYGTTRYGGHSGAGTVFRVNTNGTGFTNLHNFLPVTDGANPPAGLILLSNRLYGTAYNGGSPGNGTVFALNTDGSGFTNLHNFTATLGLAGTNSDGANPYARLGVSGNTLFGTTYQGGRWGNGTVFALKTDGTGFTNLHDFTATAGLNSTNSDGRSPYAELIVSGNVLFGTTVNGGSSGYGTVFSLAFGPVISVPLAIRPSGSNVILTWTATPSAFALQSASVVTGTFTNVPGATSPYTNTISGARNFFRLLPN